MIDYKALEIESLQRTKEQQAAMTANERTAWKQQLFDHKVWPCGNCGRLFSREDGNYQCPVCTQTEQEKRKAEEEQRRQDWRWEKNGLEGKLCGMELQASSDTKDDDFYKPFDPNIQPAALKAALRFVDEWPHGRCLVFIGAPGTGKTHLLAGITNRLIEHKHATAMYRSMVYLTNAWKRAPDWGEYHRENVEPLAKETFSFKVADQFGQTMVMRLPNLVLLLDELGREARTDQLMAELDELLDRRYSNELATVLATNLPLPAFKQYLGESLWSRIESWAEIVEMQGKWPDNDYRRRLKK